MSNDMIEATELEDEPGAPFTEGEVDNAVALLRKAVGWHIAPEQTDIVLFDVAYQETRLRLPTRYLVSVDSVSDTNGEYASTDYEVSTKLGIVRILSGYWPEGYGAVEVEMTHGYSETPADLTKVIAAIAATSRRDQTVREAAAGPYTLPLIGIDDIINRYRPLHNRFGMA